MKSSFQWSRRVAKFSMEYECKYQIDDDMHWVQADNQIDRKRWRYGMLFTVHKHFLDRTMPLVIRIFKQQSSQS